MGDGQVKTGEMEKIQNGHRNFPLGITKTEKGIHICTVAPGESCSLVVYKDGKIIEKIPFSPEEKVGDVWSMELCGDGFSGLEYCLETESGEQPDIYGREFRGREQWGDLSSVKRPVRSCFVLEDFDWEDDRPLKYAFGEMVIYRLHPRGFTKHASSHTSDRGTFKAITEKIPYMKELGITTVELLPPNEFCEVMMPDQSDGNPYRSQEPTGRLNYWGYGEGFYFAPKASYSSGGHKRPAAEFCSLVKELHQNGLELIVELYFTGKENPSLILEAVRFWVMQYHVDGVHLSGYAPAGLLVRDPWLSETKLFATSWDNAENGRVRHLGEYNDGFLVDMRSVLKGDEDQINKLIFRNRRNPAGFGVINYMANTNGFTMMDMVSYEMKHNEANGENNRDGTDYNHTWNCGVEGPTRKKKIVQMRRKQLRNAFLLLFLSQGTPLLQAGDEFGSTKNGNNNSYCQDNEISWINWNLLETNRDIFEFVKYVIAFRKEHSVFHMGTEPKNTDYLVCGHPDVSYHGVKTWCPEFENFRRQLGIMYCGEYGEKTGGAPDDYFYTAYNMHWEPHEFALPKLPKGMMWHLAFNTDDNENNGIYRHGEEPVLKNQKQFTVPPRCVVVFIGLRSIGHDAKIQE